MKDLFGTLVIALSVLWAFCMFGLSFVLCITALMGGEFELTLPLKILAFSYFPLVCGIGVVTCIEKVNPI